MLPFLPRIVGPRMIISAFLGSLRICWRFGQPTGGKFPGRNSAVRNADSAEQKAEIIVNLRSRADGGTGVMAGFSLVDGNGRRDALYLIDIGLSIMPRNCLAYADKLSTYRRWPSAYKVSKARDDLPNRKSRWRPPVYFSGYPNLHF